MSQLSFTLSSCCMQWWADWQNIPLAAVLSVRFSMHATPDQEVPDLPQEDGGPSWWPAKGTVVYPSREGLSSSYKLYNLVLVASSFSAWWVSPSANPGDTNTLPPVVTVKAELRGERCSEEKPHSSLSAAGQVHCCFLAAGTPFGSNCLAWVLRTKEESSVQMIKMGFVRAQMRRDQDNHCGRQTHANKNKNFKEGWANSGLHRDPSL